MDKDTVYVTVDYYRLDNEPINIIIDSELPPIASLLRYCSILCLQTLNCVALSTTYDSSVCQLYNTSLSAPDSLAVYDLKWKTLHGKQPKLHVHSKKSIIKDVLHRSPGLRIYVQ